MKAFYYTALMVLFAVSCPCLAQSQITGQRAVQYAPTPSNVQATNLVKGYNSQYIQTSCEYLNNTLADGNSFITKYDSIHNPIFSIKINQYYIRGVCEDAANNIYTIGIYDGFLPEISILKIDPTGNIIWKRGIPQAGSSNIFVPDYYPYDFYKAIVLSNGNVLFSFYNINSRALMLFSPSGSLLNTAEVPVSLGDIKEGFNNTIVASYFDNLGFFGANVTVSGVLLLDFNLKIIKCKKVSSPSSFFLYAIGVDESGHYYLGGVDSAYFSTNTAGGILIKMDSLLNTAAGNTVGFVPTNKKNCIQSNNGRYFKFAVKGNTITAIENLFFVSVQNPITYNNNKFVSVPVFNFDTDFNEQWSKNILIKQDSIDPFFMLADDIIKTGNQYIFAIRSLLKNTFLYYLDTAGNTGGCYNSDANLAVRKFTSTLADTLISSNASSFNAAQPGSFNGISMPAVSISNDCAPPLKPVSNFVIENTGQADTSIVCANTAVNFIDSSRNDPAVFSWVFPPQANLSNADSSCFPNISNVSFDSTGIFPVQLVACNNFGCDTIAKNIKVINPAAAPALGNDTTICTGDSLVLIYTDAVNNSHEFSGSNGLFTTADTLVIRESGTYQCTVTSPCGSQSDDIQVNFSSKPSAAFDVLISCDSLKAVFIDSSKTNGNLLLNYSWKFFDAANVLIGNSIIQNPIFLFPGYASFTVRLIVTSPDNCTASDSVTKTIYLKATPVPAFTATNDCGNLSASFTSNSSVPADTIETYSWNFGNGQLSSDKNPVTSFSNFGSQNVQLTVTSSRGCTSAPFTQIVLIRDKPVAVIDVLKDSVCSNTAFTLNGDASVQGDVITSYQWQLGGNSIGSNDTLTETLGIPATYRYTLTAGSGAGCSSDTAYQVIVVAGKPTASFSFISTCGSLSIPFTAGSAGIDDAITQHYWSFGDNSFSTEANPVKTYPAFFDSYPVKYAAVSYLGCASDTILQNVPVKDNPAVSLLYENNACENLPFTLQAVANVDGAGISNQQWWVNDVLVNTNDNLISLTKPAGNYAIKYLANSSNGCTSDTVVKNIVVDAFPLVAFTVADACVDNTILLQNNSNGNISSYKWAFGNGDSSTAVLPAYQYAAEGNYNIRLDAATGNNCTASSIQPISVAPAPTAAFNVTESCLGKAISIINNSSGNIINYTWQSSNGDNFSGFNPNIIFPEQGDYTLKLIVTSNFGCTSESSNSIRIRAVELITSADTVALINQPLQLLATGADSYVWQPANVLNNPNEDNPVFSVTNSGLYPISVEGTTAQGCKATRRFIITVYSGQAGLLVPNAFSPNADNLNDMFRLNCAGLQSLSFFRIYNRYGQPVYEQRNCSSNGWDGRYKGILQNPGAYVYVWQGIDANGKILNGKGTVMLVK